MNSRLPSQEHGPLFEVSQERRDRVFSSGSIILCAQMALIASGLVNEGTGTNWAMRSNGGLWVNFFGASAGFVLMWLGVYALATSSGSRFIRAVIPVKGRWARLMLTATLWLIAMLAFASILMMPIA